MLLLYREETKATRLTVLVVLVVALCWGPYVTSLLLHTGHTPLPPPSWLQPLSPTPTPTIWMFVCSYQQIKKRSEII